MSCETLRGREAFRGSGVMRGNETLRGYETFRGSGALRGSER